MHKHVFSYGECPSMIWLHFLFDSRHFC